MSITLPVQREKTQVKKDAELRETLAELKRNVTQKTISDSWFQADSAQFQRYRQLTLERETALGQKALTMVRRAALQNLLEQEQQQYAVELGLIGKAFYQQRI
ncbi:hypothetical protein AAFF_G00427700 [Aldrovandia affinis]|uniref:Uncharacterized protein n=1 Tax=Aldrovandia affinis TaxID=143900 RepID=A0AAD7S9M2_9TELE|nr:hypothetical protein AAFF_G00427700 [Aldrovandia affinis]